MTTKTIIQGIQDIESIIPINTTTSNKLVNQGGLPDNFTSTENGNKTIGSSNVYDLTTVTNIVGTDELAVNDIIIYNNGVQTKVTAIDTVNNAYTATTILVMGGSIVAKTIDIIERNVLDTTYLIHSGIDTTSRTLQINDEISIDVSSQNPGLLHPINALAPTFTNNNNTCGCQLPNGDIYMQNIETYEYIFMNKYGDIYFQGVDTYLEGTEYSYFVNAKEIVGEIQVFALTDTKICMTDAWGEWILIKDLSSPNEYINRNWNDIKFNGNDEFLYKVTCNYRGQAFIQTKGNASNLYFYDDETGSITLVTNDMPKPFGDDGTPIEWWRSSIYFCTDPTDVGMGTNGYWVFNNFIQVISTGIWHLDWTYCLPDGSNKQTREKVALTKEPHRIVDFIYWDNFDKTRHYVTSVIRWADLSAEMNTYRLTADNPLISSTTVEYISNMLNVYQRFKFANNVIYWLNTEGRYYYLTTLDGIIKTQGNDSLPNADYNSYQPFQLTLPCLETSNAYHGVPVLVTADRDDSVSILTLTNAFISVGVDTWTVNAPEILTETVPAIFSDTSGATFEFITGKYNERIVVDDTLNTPVATTTYVDNFLVQNGELIEPLTKTFLIPSKKYVDSRVNTIKDLQVSAGNWLTIDLGILPEPYNNEPSFLLEGNNMIYIEIHTINSGLLTLKIPVVFNYQQTYGYVSGYIPEFGRITIDAIDTIPVKCIYRSYYDDANSIYKGLISVLVSNNALYSVGILNELETKDTFTLSLSSNGSSDQPQDIYSDDSYLEELEIFKIGFADNYQWSHISI